MVLSWKKATGMRTTWQYAYDRLEENWTAEIGISHATKLEHYRSLWHMLGQPFDAHCCHTGTAIKHSVPHWVKPSFVIFDIQDLMLSRVSECPDVKNYKWRLNPVWHRMLHSCTHMATVGVKGWVSHLPCRRARRDVSEPRSSASPAVSLCCWPRPAPSAVTTLHRSWS